MSEGQKRPKRRWFRFGFRTFFAVLVFLSIAFGWIVFRAEQQRIAVRWIEDHGGYATYDVQSHGFTSRWRRWLSSIVSVNYSANVVCVHFPGGKAKKTEFSDFSNLAKLNHLKVVWFQSGKITQEQFENVQAMFPNCHVSMSASPAILFDVEY